MAGEDDLDAPELPGNTPEDGNFTAACQTQPAYSSAGSSPTSHRCRLRQGGSLLAPQVRCGHGLRRPLRARDAGGGIPALHAARAGLPVPRRTLSVSLRRSVMQTRCSSGRSRFCRYGTSSPTAHARRWTLRSSIRPLASGRIRTCRSALVNDRVAMRLPLRGWREEAAMQRTRPFAPAERRWIPGRVRAEIMLDRKGGARIAAPG
jgi:hypothetical protein